MDEIRKMAAPNSWVFFQTHLLITVYPILNPINRFGPINLAKRNIKATINILMVNTVLRSTYSSPLNSSTKLFTSSQKSNAFSRNSLPFRVKV